MLVGMLLNELQKQNREKAQQAEEIKRLAAQMAALKAVFEKRLSRLEQTIQAKNGDGKLAAAR